MQVGTIHVQNRQTVKDKIRDIMEQNRISTHALAEAIGVQKKTLQFFFNQPDRWIGQTNLEAIADFFGLSLAELYRDAIHRAAGTRIEKYSAIKLPLPLRTLKSRIESLGEKEKAVMEGRYLFKRTYAELGETLGVTKQRAKQIHDVALSKIQD